MFTPGCFSLLLYKKETYCIYGFLAVICQYFLCITKVNTLLHFVFTAYESAHTTHMSDHCFPFITYCSCKVIQDLLAVIILLEIKQSGKCVMKSIEPLYQDIEAENVHDDH